MLYSWGNSSRVVSAAALLPGVPPTEVQVTETFPPPRGPKAVEPLRLCGGLRYAGARWTASVEADWSPALAQEQFGYVQAVNVRVGATWRLSTDLLVGAGLFRDTTATAPGQGVANLDYSGVAGGLVFRPTAVIKALGGLDTWDMLTGLAVRGAYGTGDVAGYQVTYFDAAGWAVTDPSATVTPHAAPARSFEGSFSLFTTIAF
jgi:hypothetical protein